MLELETPVTAISSNSDSDSPDFALTIDAIDESDLWFCVSGRIIVLMPLIQTCSSF